MPVLVATPKSTTANSYVTVAKADIILDRRLYSTAWTSAGTSPDAEDYTVDGANIVGSTSIAISAGTGSFTAGSKIQFSNDNGDDGTFYTVSAALSGDGNITISPGLVVALDGAETVERVTATEKEKALIWATSLLDSYMIWYGQPTTDDQALRWPRFSVPDADGDYYDSDEIPLPLQAATADLALSLLESNLFATPAALGQGVSEVRAGSLLAKIDNFNQEAVIPDNILAMINELGYLEPGTGGGSNILPLLRS